MVTFSRAAATEMRERFDAMTQGKYPGVRFGTFHSVFFQILRAAYHYEGKDIATPALQYRFLEETLRGVDFDVEDEKEFLEDIQKEISRVKGDGIDIDCYYSANCPEQVFRDIFQGYQKLLQSHRALDFDDMVVYTHQLLKNRKDILARWQQQFQYILIDEFQDINRLQFETICMLAEPENNLFVVGDDDQSIYGFRGARPDIMMSFPQVFPQTERVTLDVNYRSSAEILSAAGRLIRQNKKRFPKELSSFFGKQESVNISCCRNLSSEAERIVRQIKVYCDEGIPYEDMAVLFRTNMQMRTLAAKLMEHGIPFSMQEAMPNMFRTWMARDVLCYIRLALGERDRDLFLKISNRPVRYISRSAFGEKEVSFSDLRSYYMNKKQVWMLDTLKEFENELRVLKTLSPYSALNYIRKGIGYDEFLKEYAKERGVSPDDWLEVLEEIQETARDCKSLPEWLAFVEEYGKTLEQIRQQDPDTRSEGIRLMTMHGSKGLEFQAVFIPTVNEGVSPYRKAVHLQEMEEERRMLYVAMTRARHHLHISYVRERFNKKAEPSRFLYEISPRVREQEKEH